MAIPSYPIDFHDCQRSKRMTEDLLHTKINTEIEKMIQFMNKNKTNNHSVSFEDVLIIVDRIFEDDDYYFEISVAKEHSKLRVKA
ncbi:hypothetical protein [Bacillus solitudinis]|uniref:hypothetical protein n=1 Tax=Bacillus solitudinis TaxID=2014074 RepID=UPI000C24EE1C|nr:hypothetical protein [Bacillus solitudinis]